MKKLLSVFMAAIMLIGLTACSWFGKHDNPSMQIPVADDRII